MGRTREVCLLSAKSKPVQSSWLLHQCSTPSDTTEVACVGSSTSSGSCIDSVSAEMTSGSARGDSLMGLVATLVGETERAWLTGGDVAWGMLQGSVSAVGTMESRYRDTLLWTWNRSTEKMVSSYPCESCAKTFCTSRHLLTCSRTYNDPGERAQFINGTGAPDLYGLVSSSPF